MELKKVNQNILQDIAAKEPASNGNKTKSADKFDKIVAKESDKLQAKEKPVDSDSKDYETEVIKEELIKPKVELPKEAKDEIDGTESISDLKAAIDGIIQDNSDLDLSEEALSLLNMLSMLLGSVKEQVESTKVLNPEVFISELKQKLSMPIFENLLSSLKETMKLPEGKEERLTAFLDSLVNPTVLDAMENGNEKKAVTDIKKEIFALLNSFDTSRKNDKTSETTVKGEIISLKEVLPVIKQALASKGSEHQDTATGKKEEELLKSLTTDDKSDNQDPKITNFMNKFAIMKNDKAEAIKLPEVINQKNLAGDIIKTLKYMEINSMKNLTVKINPKELGEVVINITMEAGAMKAAITASNKEAYNLLQMNLQDINSKLNNNDVKISNLSLNVYSEDTTFHSNESGREKQNQGNNKNQSKVQGISLDEETTKEDLGLESNVNKLA